LNRTDPATPNPKPRMPEKTPRAGSAPAGAPREIRSAVCTRCGCACDDADLTIAGNRVTEARNVCEVGRKWFLTPLSEEPPPARLDGREVSVDEAAAAAVDLLSRARRPLVWGLIHLASEAQGLAAELADRLGAVVDPAAGPNHAAAVTAFQEWGEVNTTLGEVAVQKSLVVLWRAEPERTHPRLLERWGVVAGDAERVIRFPARGDGGGEWSFPRERDLEFLWTLRELARGAASGARPGAVGDPKGSRPETGAGPQGSRREATGGSRSRPEAGDGSKDLRTQAARLLERLAAEPHAVLAYDAAATPPAEQHALRALAATLNGVTRFRLFPLRGGGNRVGAEAVLTWQTGFPTAVDFASGAPRANGGELGAARLLARGEVDAALVVCADPTDIPAEPDLMRLAGVPLVVLDSSGNSLAERARVALRSAPYGLASGGTFFRMDGVALSLRPALTSRYPSEAEWLRRMLDRLPAKR
jgi:formylmethanofuran dehydrogenase subunit B